MAGESRHERPPRRGRVDDGGGDSEGGKLYYHLTALAETDEGYRNLIQLSSRAYLEGYYYKPRIDWEVLDEHSAGMIVTTRCLGGHVLQHLTRAYFNGAVQAAGRPQDIVGRDNHSTTRQANGTPTQPRPP